jgi:DNA helicase II / ATP-dependent DNA helicase PcrA
MISLSGLNSKQREAAEIIDGPLLILAGAGSGKTRTLTYRIAHMVDNLGIAPKSILGVSFTNKAAREMRERVITLLGKRKARGITLATFHSLGVRILKQEIHRLGYHPQFTIYDSSDQLALIREALKGIKSQKNFDKKTVLSKISRAKNAGIGPDEFADSPFFDPEDPYDHITQMVFEQYQAKLKFCNAIDFDDILYLCVRLVEEFPEVAEKLSLTYRYIMIDEYQDTNAMQFRLIRGLTSTHHNLCVVGDDDQAIYSFRGADISNILSFEKTYPGAHTVKLEENYRSTTPILDLANAVIKDNPGRKEKTLWSQKTSNDLPLLWKMADTDHEAQVVIEDIVQHQGKGGHLGDIAILYRSNTQTQPLEDELRLSQVPYTIIGGQKFYEKKEIKDLIAYLCSIHNPNDQMNLRRILNVPHRGIGQITLEKFLKNSEDQKVSLFEAILRAPEIAGPQEKPVQNFVELMNQLREEFKLRSLPEAISLLVERIHFLEMIDKSYDNAKQAERRRNDVMNFIQSAERFQRFFPNRNCLEEFIERMLLQDSQDREEDEDEDHDIRKNEVTLMTLHASKGLEFPIVYLIGVEEELLPHKKTITLGQDVSEECRLAYVGLTRAQEKLVMTYCKERKLYGKQTPRYLSRFLMNVHDRELYREQDRTTFNHMSEDEFTEYKSNFFQGLMDGLGSDDE